MGDPGRALAPSVGSVLVDIELTPQQPAAVVEAVVEVLAPPPRPDPWWQAGIEEALQRVTS
jgi:hypothetical protein